MTTTTGSRVRITSLEDFGTRNVWADVPVLTAQIEIDSSVFDDGIWPRDIASELEQALSEIGVNNTAWIRDEIQPLASRNDYAQLIARTALELLRDARIEVGVARAGAGRSSETRAIAVEDVDTDITAIALRVSVALCEQVVLGKQPAFDLGRQHDRIRQFRESSYRRGSPGYWLHARARQESLPAQRHTIDQLLFDLGSGNSRRRYRFMTSSLGGRISQILAKDKTLSYHILNELGIPVPPGAIASSVSEAREIANQIGFPVITKPVDGNHAKGVTLDIQDHTLLETGFHRASQIGKSGTVIVERFVLGDHFRILIIDGQLVNVLERLPAQITGDGVTTNQQLIDNENHFRSTLESRARPLKPLPNDGETRENLSRQGHTLESIPEPGEIVKVRWVGPQDGGMNTDVTDQVHPDTIEAALQATCALGIDICGIDYISPNIATSIFEAGAIVEMNTAPAVMGHRIPDEGPGSDVAGAILNALLPPDRQPRPLTILVAKSDRSKQICHELARRATIDKYSVGLSTTAETLVATMPLDPARETSEGKIRTLLDHPETDLVIAEIDPVDFTTGQIGCEQIDVLLLEHLTGATTPLGEPVETLFLRSLEKQGTLFIGSDHIATELQTHIFDGNVSRSSDDMETLIASIWQQVGSLLSRARMADTRRSPA